MSADPFFFHVAIFGTISGYITMIKPLEDLEKKRKNILLLNVIYAFVILVVGAAIFFLHLYNIAWALILACILLYLLVVWPAGRRYSKNARAVILREVVCKGMKDFCYDPKGGIDGEKVWETGLIRSTKPDTFLAREHITGKMGNIDAELADITFPVNENGHDAVFTGSFIGLTYPKADFPRLFVREGNLNNLGLPPSEYQILKEIGEFIPGSLYVYMKGERLVILLRGRFLGYRITRTMPVTDENPYPEFLEAVEFGKKRM